MFSRAIESGYLKPDRSMCDGVLELTGCRRLLAMDWNNREKLAGWVMVQSKELDYDNDGCDVDPADAKQITLEQCLSIFTEPEKLSPEEAWFCPRCKAHREATKQMSLWRLPTILIVQLKRFSFKNLIWRDKIDKMVVYPIRGLDLSPYWCTRLQPGDPVPIYDLYAVVNHHGNILGGHYTTYSRLPDLLDSRKSSLDGALFRRQPRRTMLERNACAKSAYLLLLPRRRKAATTPPFPAPPPGRRRHFPPLTRATSRHDDDDDDDAVRRRNRREPPKELGRRVARGAICGVGLAVGRLGEGPVYTDMDYRRLTSRCLQPLCMQRP
ncbi:PREDICTED: ubiquitin carboxyl-terminal hydrolase 19-like [Priapulus caudatus]|uniref:ubiquitinyl hydrolase 1 n=1 Tax=Priapulus caudatus TaxID=37621 RepID=A0ABM1EUX2_PRICU|nr:PREDICTED: ubiquitin carboxyl-terminal hydrolase 19-like [Priapulus caudatus]